MTNIADYIINRLGYVGVISGTMLTLYVSPAVAEDLTLVFNKSDFGRNVASLGEIQASGFTQLVKIDTSKLEPLDTLSYELIEKARENLETLPQRLAQQKLDLLEIG